MEHFEQTAIASAEHKPSLWLRYVDHIFSIWAHGDCELEKFLKHLNTQRPAITFTIEKESKEKLQFLDIPIDGNNDKITTLVYIKPTHTYLHYTFNHPKSTKQAIVTSLQNRANMICLNKDDLRKEYQHTASTLSANGYPQNILTRKHRNTDNPTAQEKHPPSVPKHTSREACAMH